MTDRERQALISRFEVLRGKGFTRRQILRMGAGVLSASAFATLLAACGGDDDDDAEDTATEPAAGNDTTPETDAEEEPTEATEDETPTGDETPAGDETPSGDAGAGDWEPSEPVTIEYWQYAFASKVELVDQLIPRFQEQNPMITVEHVTHPYDAFRQQVQAAVQAGEGPDVLNVFYGWVPAYYLADFLKPMPESVFPTATIEEEFFPMLSSVAFDGQYYAIPTAVRTLGLFWNQDLLSEAGFDAPPATWDELQEIAIATTVRDSSDVLQQAGFTLDIGGQGHSYWRSCLTRQNGQQPISDDNTEIFWTEPASVEAFTWFMDLYREHGVGETGFNEDGATAFQNGVAAMHIDGSYRVGTYETNAPDLPYAVAVLPEKEAQASYASFWCNTITRNAEGDREMAAAKFIEFLASNEVMEEWTPAIGELPARVEAAQAFADDEKLGAFVEQLPYSYADFFVDETATRQAVIDAVDRVLLQEMDDAESLEIAEQEVQATLDEYWSDIEG